MSTIHRLLGSFVIILAGAALISAATAAEAEPEARIVKIVGSGTAATVVVNGVAQPARDGMAVPQSAIIQSSGQEVYLEVAVGVVASIKPGSQVVVSKLNATDTELELKQGRLVSQLDKNRPNKKSYGVKVGNGVAAARGTAFTVTNDTTGSSVTTTADGVSFTTAAGTVTIQAGQYTFTPAGSSVPSPAVPLSAAASDPTVAAIIREAVNTAATVVQNNLGSISAESATNIVAQVVSVAVSALPNEATAFTSTAVTAVTAAGSATAGAADNAAGAITAAAVAASPEQAGAIAGAAAAAAPAQAGVITAAAQQVAPSTSKEAIAERVAASTGQSTTTVQSNADASSNTATNAVNTAKDATSNVVAPPATNTTPPPSGEPSSTPKTNEKETTPLTPVNPDLNVSPST